MSEYKDKRNQGERDKLEDRIRRDMKQNAISDEDAKKLLIEAKRKKADADQDRKDDEVRAYQAKDAIIKSADGYYNERSRVAQTEYDERLAAAVYHPNPWSEEVIFSNQIQMAQADFDSSNFALKLNLHKAKEALVKEEQIQNDKTKELGDRQLMSGEDDRRGKGAPVGPYSGRSRGD